tara:strand:- start:210 stop:938 length:729 start_codon:yes stop_codon:yes gene_type:complete
MVNLKNILAVVPARSGSKGLSDKNIKLLNGHPLLAWSILSAKRLGIQEVYLSTDSSDYAEVGKKYGASVPELRPDYLSSDSSLDCDFLRHAIKIYCNSGKNFSHILHLRPTTPSRSVSVMQMALDQLKVYNSPYLRSCHPAPESPMKWYYKRNNLAKQLSKEYNLNARDENRQSYETVYIPNGYIDILDVEHFLKYNDLYQTEVLLFETEPVIEVDTKFEFDLLSALSQENNADIYAELLNG